MLVAEKKNEILKYTTQFQILNQKNLRQCQIVMQNIVKKLTSQSKTDLELVKTKNQQLLSIK